MQILCCIFRWEHGREWLEHGYVIHNIVWYVVGESRVLNTNICMLESCVSLYQGGKTILCEFTTSFQTEP